VMDVALLGWREACLEVENSLEDRGREERRTLLVDLRRLGLRGMETGRLSCLLSTSFCTISKHSHHASFMQGNVAHAHCMQSGTDTGLVRWKQTTLIPIVSASYSLTCIVGLLPTTVFTQHLITVLRPIVHQQVAILGTVERPFQLLQRTQSSKWINYSKPSAKLQRSL